VSGIEGESETFVTLISMATMFGAMLKKSMSAAVIAKAF
jgi:hypothetical protein